MTLLRCIAYGPDSKESGFGALSEEWNPLLCRSRFNSFFLTHEWQTIWWENLGSGDLWILAFFDHGSEYERGAEQEAERGKERAAPSHSTLVGIAPLYLYSPASGPRAGQKTFTLVGCTEVSDYLDLIIEEGREREVYEAFISWLGSAQAPAWQHLDLCNLPEESLTYETLPQILKADGLLAVENVDVFLEDVAPYFELPDTYETYLQTLVDKKQRHELRRKQRRIEREAVCEFRIVGSENLLLQSRNLPNGQSASNGISGQTIAVDSTVDSTVDSAAFVQEMDEFLRLQMASREDKAEFMTDEMADFFRNMAHFIQQRGYLRLCFLRVDGVNAACVMAFEYNGRLWLYNSGYDPTIFANLSPGWVILSYTIQYAIAAGLKVYDFMQGDEEYKYRFGAQNYKVMRVIASRV